VTEQLDLFRNQPAADPAPDPDPEPQPTAPIHRKTQMTELPGETFEDIFGDAA
jgi:hypothetical protein